MKCPECVAAGQQSVVQLGATLSTLLHSPSFYDEEGRTHTHDLNTRTQNYQCTRGHHWTEKQKGSCWCGWTGV